MNTRFLLGIALALVAAVAVGCGSDTVSTSEARGFINTWLQDKAQNCLQLPVIGDGMKVYVKIDAIMTQEQKFVYENSMALVPFERAGIVTIETVQQTPGYYFKIANVRLASGAA